MILNYDRAKPFSFVITTTPPSIPLELPLINCGKNEGDSLMNRFDRLVMNIDVKIALDFALQHAYTRPVVMVYAIAPAEDPSHEEGRRDLIMNNLKLILTKLSESPSLREHVGLIIFYNERYKKDVHDSYEKYFHPSEGWMCIKLIEADSTLIDSPQNVLNLYGALRDIVKKLERINKQPNTYASGIIGISKEIRNVVGEIERVAQMDVTALILGESGVGKELVAKSIHLASPRKDKPYVAVNSAGLPNDLIESELFGYEKGAFTGAYKQKKGKFELADTGTLFLDEIGDLDLRAQVKILRAIQEKTIQRLGGEQDIAVDVRFVAATNKNLGELVRDGRFRDDLYYRINVVPLLVPPLRERMDDIPVLASYFLSISTKNTNFTRSFNSDAMSELSNYWWPGNIRELKNVVERIVVASSNEIIGGDEVRATLRKLEVMRSKPDELMSLAETEKRHIEKVLNSCGSNISQCSKILDIDPKTLRAKIALYDLKRN